jgi:L-alanine-DL-glutamate epimerase-like enolase superfamily enzyme
MNLAAPTARWFEHHEALGHDEVPGLAPGFTITDGVARPNGKPGLGFDVDLPEFERHCRWAT